MVTGCLSDFKTLCVCSSLMKVFFHSIINYKKIRSVIVSSVRRVRAVHFVLYGKPKSGMIDCKMLSRLPHGGGVCTQQVNHIVVPSAKGKRAAPQRRRYIILIFGGYIGLHPKYVYGCACMCADMYIGRRV